jgi:hypothetical protein
VKPDQISPNDELELTIGNLQSNIVLNKKTRSNRFHLERALSPLDAKIKILKASGELFWER